MSYLHQTENNAAKSLIFVVHCIQVLFVTPEANFTLFKGYSDVILENPYSKLEANTAIACCRLCLRSEGQCAAINYKDISDECEMLNANQLVDSGNPNTVYSSGWLVYVMEDRCEEGWKGFNNRCYIAGTDKQKWANSITNCNDIGAELVEISSEQEQVFLNDLATMNNLTSYWTGLSDEEQEGTFKLVSGLAVVYLNWDDGMPNNLTDQDCVLNLDGKWKDLQCTNRRQYICEKGNG